MRVMGVTWLLERERVPVAIRARFEKAFFGLGSFTGMVLLVWGFYLIRDAVLHPLGESDVGVLAAGFALALSSFLLVSLVWWRGRIALAKWDRRSHASHRVHGPVLTVYGHAVQRRFDAEEAMQIGKELPGPM
jgi:hypothetical protein